MNVHNVMLRNNFNSKLNKITHFVKEYAILIIYTILMYKTVCHVLLYLALLAILVV